MISGSGDRPRKEGSTEVVYTLFQGWLWCVTRSWNPMSHFHSGEQEDTSSQTPKENILVELPEGTEAKIKPTLTEDSDKKKPLDHDKFEATTKTMQKWTPQIVRAYVDDGRNVVLFSPCVLSWFDSDPGLQPLSWCCFGLKRFQEAWLRHWRS